MSLRIDTVDLYPGSCVIGVTGLGVLGSDIPSAGTNGASVLWNDISLPADAAKEIRARIVSAPAAGTLFMWEDGSASLTGAPDGVWSMTYALIVDGVEIGTTTATFTIGAGSPGGTLSGNATLGDMTVSGGLSTAGEASSTIETLGYVSSAVGRQWQVSWRENGWVWPTKFVGERVTAKFDFTKDLPYGDAIAAVAMAVTLVGGVDATPAAVLYGAPTVRGGRVFHQLSGGNGDCTYFVQCQITTTQNNIFQLAGVLPVQAL